MFCLILDDQLRRGYRGLVHVEGWNKAAVFEFVSIDDSGMKILITPRSRKKVKTRNNLLTLNK